MTSTLELALTQLNIATLLASIAAAAQQLNQARRSSLPRIVKRIAL